VLAKGGFWSGAESTACEQFLTGLGPRIPVIYEQAIANGSKVQPVGGNIANAQGAAVLTRPEAAS
jgi:hypothetical protein